MERPSPESNQMSKSLAAIRERLARMRVESTQSLDRLAATRQAADVSARARQVEPPADAAP